MKACFSAYLSCSDASLTASMFPPTTSATMHPCPSSLPDVVDSLLAHAGYSVKASEIAHVAHRLEQLESYLCAAQEAGISHLSSEAVHYNPSDLAGWIECMIGELAPSIGEIKLPTSSQIREGVREFGDFGSSSGLDSSQMERSSYNIGDARNNTTTQIKFVQSGSMETLSHFKETITQQQAAVAVAPAPATTISRYGVKDLSGLPLMEQLQEFQYKDGSEDQASSNQISTFYNNAALQAVDLPNTTLPSMLLHQRPYPHQLEQLHHPRLQQNLMNHGAHPSPTSNGTSPFADQIIRPLYQHHGQDHNQFLDSHNGRATYAQQPPPELLPSMHEEEGAQESGVRLVHLLMACAQAVQKNELAPAHEMVREIRRLASPQSGAMGKVATCFVDALARRIYTVNSHDWQLGSGPGDGFSELLYLHFYETCPYLKFAHFTANQAILEAFEGHKFVHVIDFNLMQGLQWPALIQALALRPGGPPRLRLTGIGPPQPDDKDVLQEIGMKLAQLADSVNVEFDFRGVVASKLDDVKPWMLHVQPGEAVAVNSILQLHRLLYGEPSLSTPIDEVLRYVKSLNPRIITLVEQEGNHNNPCFLDRFMEALQYYCTMFDSLEACSHPPQSSEVAFTEMYLAREIVDIVACEGAARVERHETLAQWRERMSGAGFKPLHLGSNAFKQASMLLTLFSGEGYTVEENNGCLTLGWHSRPLIAASSWQCG